MLGTLDRYVVRNFLHSYLLCFLVLMGLRVVADLFVNMDEFAELGLPFLELVRYVGQFYAYQSLLYFRELGGVIIVAAAAFSLARMNHTNELTAILASGVSLHRVVAPVVLLSVLLSGLSILNQELLIPRCKEHLVRKADDMPGTERFQVPALDDVYGSVWYAREFTLVDATMRRPLAVLRRPGDGGFLGRVAGLQAVWQEQGLWRFEQASLAIAGSARTHSTWLVRVELAPWDLLDRANHGPDGRISLSDAPEQAGPQAHPAEQVVQAVVSAAGVDRQAGQLIEPRFDFYLHDAQPDPQQAPRLLASIEADRGQYVRLPDEGDRRAYELQGGRLLLDSDMDPQELTLRKNGRWLEFMSTAELNDTLQVGKAKDPRRVHMTRHVRFIEPIGNLMLLLLGLPFILSRERNIKTSAGLCVLVVGSAYVFIFLSRYLGESGLPPVLAVWLPILVLGPIAVLLVDAVKT